MHTLPSLTRQPTVTEIRELYLDDFEKKKKKLFHAVEIDYRDTNSRNSTTLLPEIPSSRSITTFVPFSFLVEITETSLTKQASQSRGRNGTGPRPRPPPLWPRTGSWASRTARRRALEAVGRVAVAAVVATAVGSRS